MSPEKIVHAHKNSKEIKSIFFRLSFVLDPITYGFSKKSYPTFLAKKSINLYLLITKDTTQYIQSGILSMSNLTLKYYKFC